MTFMLWRRKGEVFFDGEVVADGGSLTYYQKNTTTPLDIFSDATGSTPVGTLGVVTLNSSGALTTPIYVGETDFDEILKDSAGNTIFTGEDYEGSPPAAASATYARPRRPVSTSSASSLALTADDVGKVFDIDPTAVPAGITATLPDGAGLQNGDTVWTRHAGSSYTAIIAPYGLQTLRGRGGAITGSFTMTDAGEVTGWTWDGAGWMLSDYVVPPGLPTNVLGNLPINCYLSPSVSGNALTVAIKTASGADPTPADPAYIPFRSATNASGAIAWRKIVSAKSITVPASASLGTSNSVPFRVRVVAQDTGTDAVLAVVNCFTSTGVSPLVPGSARTSTTISSGSTSAGTLYASTGQTTKGICELGCLDFSSGLATAGQWSSAPDITTNVGHGYAYAGETIQRQYSKLGTLSSSSSAIPADDTIPQSTEGGEHLTVAITPTSAASLLVIDSVLYVSYSGATSRIASALFQDSNANALSCGSAGSSSATDLQNIKVHHEMKAATTSSTTFKIRAGVATGGTIYVNGASAAQLYGGVLSSFISVHEIAA